MKPEEHEYQQKYTPKGQHIRASARQLWRLGQHDHFLHQALIDSGTSMKYITADVAHEKIQWLLRNGWPKNEGDA